MEDAETTYGVFLSLTYGVADILIPASRLCPGSPLDAVLTDFPRHMLTRLEEIEATRAALQAWGDLFPAP